ncbi:MAG TPA: lipocalin family protein [Gemmatimonadaceae bacterium]
MALAVVAVACIDTTPTQYFNQGGFNSNGSSGGGGSGGAIDSNLVGTWTETIVDTVNGDPTNQQTIWAFNANGTASLTVITFDITTSAADTTIKNGTWTADGSTVTITFQAPNTGTEEFTYVINGSTLLLGQTEFVRTG